MATATARRDISRSAGKGVPISRDTITIYLRTCGGISIKEATNIHHVSECAMLTRFSRSEVKGQGYRETKCTFRRRHTLRRWPWCRSSHVWFLLLGAHSTMPTELAKPTHKVYELLGPIAKLEFSFRHLDPPFATFYIRGGDEKSTYDIIFDTRRFVLLSF